jgi:hypothetical protein
MLKALETLSTIVINGMMLLCLVGFMSYAWILA